MRPPPSSLRATQTYLLQFLRGVGDEDDGADIQIDVGGGNTGASNVVWLQGRSASNSAHYLQAQAQAPSIGGVGPFAIALTQAGTWPLDAPDGLSWYAAPQLAPMGAPDTDQCLAIVDLSVMMPANVAQILVQSIAAGQLGADDARDLWLGVNHYMHWN